ncbi:MAG: YdeI/OmpD-associated family protein [Bacteroidetes bacterium]|nr:YdeI/OmpD-associated family protein [Bacteroidota bacterium]
MGKRDKRVDQYISKSQDFAKPILKHLRDLVHVSCPEVEETIKWGFPHFDYRGIMCSMAAFKKHCSFGFWKAAMMKDTSLMQMAKSEAAMGHLGQIQSLQDLPSDKVMKSYIMEAARLNEGGVKVRKASPAKKVPLKIPPYLKKALEGNKKAKEFFLGLSYSHQKDYLTWLAEAKTQPTLEKRLATTMQWLSVGKRRNWKYER